MEIRIQTVTICVFWILLSAPTDCPILGVCIEGMTLHFCENCRILLPFVTIFNPNAALVKIKKSICYLAPEEISIWVNNYFKKGAKLCNFSKKSCQIFNADPQKRAILKAEFKIQNKLSFAWISLGVLFG